MNEELKEVWKVYKDTRHNSQGHLYEVSTIGRVKVDGIIEEPKIHFNYLYCRQFAVHRMVAEAHIPNPENKPCVDHIDTDRLNNRVDNLRWVTYSENMNNPITKERIIKHNRGETNPMYGKHWYTNGVDNVFTFECPEGFYRGRNYKFTK